MLFMSKYMVRIKIMKKIILPLIIMVVGLTVAQEKDKPSDEEVLKKAGIGTTIDELSKFILVAILQIYVFIKVPLADQRLAPPLIQGAYPVSERSILTAV